MSALSGEKTLSRISRTPFFFQAVNMNQEMVFTVSLFGADRPVTFEIGGEFTEFRLGSGVLGAVDPDLAA
jgi:hypothetical protein